MASIKYEDDIFMFEHGVQQKELLDLNLFMTNKSRYPMQMLPDGKTGLYSLLTDLKDSHKRISDGREDVFPYYLTDILAVSYLVRTSAPLKVLEIGASSGILSYHLAVLMGKMNAESKLCCVSNVIGNDSENHWLDKISMVEEPPDLSFLVSDYEDTQLETGKFDFVVLNGTERFDKPYETIREAERLVKKNGVLLCYVKDAPLLESCFKLIFPEHEEYPILYQEMILEVTKPESSWKEKSLPELETEVSGLFAKLRQVVKNGRRPEEVRPLIHQIDACVDMAVQQYDIDRKAGLLQLKRIVLDYMLNIGKELEEYYRNELLQNIGE